MQWNSCWQRVAAGLGIQITEEIAPILERFHTAALRQLRYQYIYHENDGGLTESDSLLYSEEMEK